MNEITKTEANALIDEQAIELFEQYAIAEARLEQWKADNRQRFMQFFEANEIKKIDTDEVTISYIAPHTTRRVNIKLDDLKAYAIYDKFGELVPDEKLISETGTEASIRFKFKEA